MDSDSRFISILGYWLMLLLAALAGGITTWLFGKLYRPKSFAQDILDQAPTIICVGDLEGRYRFVNAQYEEVFGQPGKALVGRPLAEILPSQQVAIILQEIDAVVASGECKTFEEEITLPEGTHTHLKVKFPLKNWMGEIHAVGTIFLDIADRKQIERELRQRNELLESVSRLKLEFLSNVSHELRTPLVAILGFSNLLLQQIFAPLTSKQKEYLSRIRESGDRLLTLINALLDATAIEAGMLELTMQATPVLQLCQEALQRVEALADSKQQQLLLEDPVVEETILVDRGRVAQMLLNYLHNAIESTPAGGSIILRTRIASLDELKLEALSPNVVLEVPCFLVLSVSDTGTGVPSDQQHLLFQSFQQLDGASNRVHEGIGLGLFLTRALAELHGGTVSFASTAEKGSVFSIWLPFVSENADQ
jgi:PAS domain S-box-containing protein